MLTCAARRHLGWLSCCLALVLVGSVGCNEKKSKSKSDAKAVAKAEQAKLEQAKAKAAAEEKAKADAAKKKAEQLPPVGSKGFVATAPKDRKRTEGFSTSVQGREGFGSSTFQEALAIRLRWACPAARWELAMIPPLIELKPRFVQRLVIAKRWSCIYVMKPQAKWLAAWRIA